MKKHLLLGFTLFFSFFLSAQQAQTVTEDLSIVPLSKNTFLHVGMLQTQSFGRVDCNGLVYIKNGEAVVIDTPPDTAQSTALLQWIEKIFPCTKVKAVIVTHFHDDCLAGLPVFHRRGIPSYANNLSITLAASRGVTVPQRGFQEQWELNVGGEKISSRFFREAHTKDNIVNWIPSEKILFGGCQVKAMGSGKGNLADANVLAWSHTTRAIKTAYPDAAIVVPGHGKVGDRSLLDFTISLFESGKNEAATLIFSGKDCETGWAVLRFAGQCILL
ncbi:MAG: subclass B1 metallo-beta-lactamase [Chitinophagaceae bacterium]|nr:MAG: subclass B1 metallo-beta-lactamase [Chitinophagaceae bacterium]